MLSKSTVSFGADPELFLRRGGKIVGSERLIPVEGLSLTPVWDGTTIPRVVRDGFQIELHPQAGSIQLCLFSLKQSLLDLNKAVKETRGEFELDFSELVEVDFDEVIDLSPEARLLGCLPSENVYGLGSASLDGLEYLKRTGGGHLHFGFYAYSIMTTRQDVVPLLDWIVGNTGVILNSGPDQIERRKNYGKVGEFRSPSYGLEYRTLSNFWLRSPILAELMMQLGWIAVSLYVHTVNNSYLERSDLEHAIDYKKVMKAIQRNDPKLAMKNWEIVSEWIKKNTYGFFPNRNTIDQVTKFLQKVQADGLESIFPINPDAVIAGWEGYTTQSNQLSDFMKKF